MVSFMILGVLLFGGGDAFKAIRPHSKLLTVVRNQPTTTSSPAAANLSEIDRATSYGDAVRIFHALGEQGRVQLFNSSKLAGNRRVTPVELKMKTGITGDVAEKLGLRAGQERDRLAAGVGLVTFAAMVSGVAASELLLPGPPVLRFVVVTLLCFSPFVLLLVGLQLPDTTQFGLTQVQQRLFPGFRRRLVVHEAGHFLCGYLCGLPIETYSVNSAVNAVKLWSLDDDSSYSGSRRKGGRGGSSVDRAAVLRVMGVTNNIADVLAAEPFQGSKREEDKVGGATRGATGGAWEEWDRRRREEEASNRQRDREVLSSAVGVGPRPYEEEEEAKRRPPRLPTSSSSSSFRQPSNNKRRLKVIDDAVLDRVAVVSMAGAIAEVIEFGSAEGGRVDFDQLRNILLLQSSSSSASSMAATAPAFRSRVETEKARQREAVQQEREQEARVRWACVAASTMIQNNQNALEALASAMDQGCSVSECVLVIESAQKTTQLNTRQMQQREKKERGSDFEGTLANSWFKSAQGARDSDDDNQRAPLVNTHDVLPLTCASTAAVVYICFVAHIF